MAYTANVPQASQTVAQTQSPIQANFQFIPASIGQEHNFDATDATKTYHLQASMPNNGGLPTIPAAANGAYYVDGGQAHFYDGTVDWLLNNWQGVASGTYTPTSQGFFNDIFTLPPSVAGMILLYRTSSSGGNNLSMLGTFFTDTTICYAYSSLIKINSSSNDCAIELNNINNDPTPSLAIQGRAGFGIVVGVPFTYRIFYRPV